VQVSQVSSTKADSASTLATETKTYGDTLSTQSFVPAAPATDTGQMAQDTTSVTDTESSHGIKFKETFTPQYNKAGKYTGDKVSVVAIAKPTTTTDTQETKAASVSTTIVKDSTAKVQSTTKTTAGIGFGSWVLIGGLIVVAAVVIYFVFIKKLI